MKKNLSKFWAVGLTIVILTSLLVGAVPASAGTLSWSAAPTQPSATDTMNFLVGPAGTNIVDLAVANNGTTIYAAAVDGTSTRVVYKSTDTGKTWTSLTAGSSFPTVGTIQKIAVAPDDANIVAILIDDIDAVIVGVQPGVYVTQNAGSSWSNLTGLTSLDVYFDLDISPAVSAARNVTVAGTGGANTPRLFYFNLGNAVPSWTNAAAWAPAIAPYTAIDAYNAIKFSPNFASDRVAVVVSEELTVANVARVHMVSFSSKKWDGLAGGAGFTDFPVPLLTVTANAANMVNYADLSLAPDYLAADETSRIVFVGASITTGVGEEGGIFRLSNTSVKSLRATTDIKSVSFNGTNLVAGAGANNNVFRSANPLVTDPSFSSAAPYKRPGTSTSTAVVVAFAGSNVVAGTTGTPGAAFSLSTDAGASFNDISLVDTGVTNFNTLQDLYVTDNGARIYLLANDGISSGLWLNDGTSWQRVFDIATANFIVRGFSDGTTDTIYIAQVAATNLYYSANGGSSWQVRASNDNVQDMAIESKDVAYIAKNASPNVSKTTNGGFTWASGKDSQVGGSIHTITSLGTDQLIVGSVNGRVAYSTDGNSSWTKIDTALNAASPTHVTASGLASGGYIYAATQSANTRVERWKIGSSTSWTNLVAGVNALQSAYGIGLRDGALYVLTSDAAGNSELRRTLEPTMSSGDAAKWSGKTVTKNLNDAPKALVLTSGSVKAFAISTGDATLQSLTDVLVGAPLTVTSPADKFQVPVNPLSGNANAVTFTWSRPTSQVTDYDFAIYADEAGDIPLYTPAAINSAASTVSHVVGPAQFAFTPGSTYYWRVRVNLPILGAWSGMRVVTIQPGVALVTKPLSPANGATAVSKTPSFSWEPVSGTTKYQFTLSAKADLSSPIVSTQVSGTAYAVTAALDAGKTYYWSVKPVEPVAGDQSAIANFTVAAAAPPATTPPAPPPQTTVIITQVPPPTFTIPPAPPAQTIVITPPAAPAPIAPAYIWAIIIIGAILVISVIVLIVRTRRTV